MTTLQRALDKAIRAENRRAVLDSLNTAKEAVDSIVATGQPKYPAGTPEYEAYAAELRAELAKWVAGTGEYARGEDF